MLFSRDDLLRVLHGLNPWWTRAAPPLPAYRRPTFEACRQHVDARTESFVLLLSGLRGTGKTTMLQQVAAHRVAKGADPRSVLYLDVGHPIFARVPLPQILQLHREMVYARDRPAVLLLDELHYARDWDQHVKALLLDAAGNRVIATESVQMIERALITESQVTRWSAIPSTTLSFHEYLMLRGAETPRARETLDIVRREPIEQAELERAARAAEPAAPRLRAYLTSGGLPLLATLPGDPSARRLLLEDAVENALRRDISLHFGPRSAEDLKRLFVFLCMHTGDVFPVQRYARAVEVSAATIASWIEILERCFLVRRIAPRVAGGAIVRKPRYRVFVSDATVRNVQLVRDEASLSDPEEAERVIATALVRHVVERYGRTLAKCSYWRDPRTGRAVDVIVHDGDRTIAFQTMYRRARMPSRDDAIVQYCRRERVARVVLATESDEDLGVFRLPGLDTEFVKAPAHALLQFLGRAEAELAAS